MKFLIIDDSPYDRELIIRKLRKEFSDSELVEIIRRKDFDAALEQGDFDVVLVDYRLQWTDGLRLLKILKERFPDIPVIMVTDTGSEEIAAEGMKSGLSDYVLKRYLERLPIAVKESLEKARLRKMEEHFRQAQRMESLGQLISGIAHDFNNMLGGISGYTDRSLSMIDENNPLYSNLIHIREIATRAAKMTRQLLAFSRRQVIDPTDVDLNKIISDLLDLMDGTLGEFIEVEFIPDPALRTVFVDSSQIGQVFMNLCINARDAMPNGGKLLIQTQNVTLDEEYCSTRPNILPGPYVLLTVKDTGMGMDRKLQERIFEPFFTTKEVGKGTGLGLSMVHGIVGQHNGIIEVESEVGKGTTFKVYLPSVDRVPVEQPETKVMELIQGGTETVLLVEDDPDLRMLMEDILREYGYSVLSASNGEEGLREYEEHSSVVSLIIADVVTPKMKGKELHERISRLNPKAKFLFVSGYSANEVGRNFVLEKGVKFLQKPFDLDQLATTVREILG